MWQTNCLLLLHPKAKTTSWEESISIEKVLQLSNISTKLVLALGATYQAVKPQLIKKRILRFRERRALDEEETGQLSCRTFSMLIDSFRLVILAFGWRRSRELVCHIDYLLLTRAKIARNASSSIDGTYLALPLLHPEHVFLWKQCLSITICSFDKKTPSSASISILKVET